MKHISDLFSKYKENLKPPQSSVVKEFIITCDEVVGLKIKKEQCNYTPSTKTIYLQTPSLIKTELLKRKSDLLMALTKKLGKNAPKEII